MSWKPKYFRRCLRKQVVLFLTKSRTSCWRPLRLGAMSLLLKYTMAEALWPERQALPISCTYFYKSCWWPWMYNSLYRWRIETHSQCHSCQNKSNFRTSFPQLWDNVIFHLFFFQSSPYGIEQRFYFQVFSLPYWN